MTANSITSNNAASVAVSGAITSGSLNTAVALTLSDFLNTGGSVLHRLPSNLNFNI